MTTDAQKRASRESARRKREKDRDAYNTYMRGWSERNRETVRASNRASYYRAKTRMSPDEFKRRARGYQVKTEYGLTPVQVAELFEESDGLCAMCYAALATQIDHDHATGVVRGALCNKCNTILGLCNDDLAPAMAYLSVPRMVEADLV